MYRLVSCDLLASPGLGNELLAAFTKALVFAFVGTVAISTFS